MKKIITGFTIVELLIVIVVIGILSTISFVAYRGIREMANDSAVQAEINQMYKGGQVADTDGSLPQGEDETQERLRLDYMNAHMKVSAKSYDLSYKYPLVALYKYDWETQNNVIEFAAASQSGRVFMVTKSNGGVSRSIGGWAEYKEYLEEQIDYLEEDIANPPEWCDSECQAEDQEELNLFQTRLQRANQLESQGKDFWITEIDSCGGVETILGGSFGILLFKASTQQWVLPQDEESTVECTLPT